MKKIIYIAIIIILLGLVYLLIPKNGKTTENVNQNNKVDLQTISTTTAETKSATSSQSQIFKLSDIALHKNKESCWTVIDGNVYDVTPFIESHPGGVPNILLSCGIDATEIFKKIKKHSGPKAIEELVKLKIGTLSQ